MTDRSTLMVERRSQVVTVTFARPELLNRFDEVAHAEFIDALGEIRGMHDVRAVVLAAEGTCFSAGGDFELMLAANASVAARRRIVDDGYHLLSSLLDVVPPIVAAVQGDAIGLGATIALACDIVVTHPRCTFCDPHVSIGLVAGDGGCLTWPQSAGMAIARRHLLTGDPLTGELAHRAGLISDLVEHPDDVLPTAQTLADRLAALPPLAVQGTKAALNGATRARFDEVIRLGLVHELTTLGSADLLEAIDAFKERRAPTYRGR